MRFRLNSNYNGLYKDSILHDAYIEDDQVCGLDDKLELRSVPVIYCDIIHGPVVVELPVLNGPIKTSFLTKLPQGWKAAMAAAVNEHNLIIEISDLPLKDLVFSIQEKLKDKFVSKLFRMQKSSQLELENELSHLLPDQPSFVISKLALYIRNGGE